jgi:hypothetical protein
MFLPPFFGVVICSSYFLKLVFINEEDYCFGISKVLMLSFGEVGGI